MYAHVVIFLARALFQKTKKMEKSTYRAYILIRYKLGKSAKEIHDELKLAHPFNAPSLMTVWRWVDRFKSGSEDLEDHDRPGAPITATTPANIEAVRQLINDDPHISLHHLEAQTSLSYGSIETIIHKHLHLRKLASRWVPHLLTASQKAKRLAFCKQNLAKFNEGKWRLCDVFTGDESWIYLRHIGSKQSNSSWVGVGEPSRTVVRQGRFEPKCMITVMFKSTGPLLVHYLEKGEAICAQTYIEDCLTPVIGTIRQQRPKSGTKSMKILHDNAKPHVAKIVREYLNSEGITIIDHPPYSPDLAPSDFCLFSYIKQRLTDHPDVQSLKKQITRILAEKPKEEWQKTFDKYLERMQLCVDNKGEYFEHLIK